MTFTAAESFPFGDVAMSSVSSPTLGHALIVQRVAFTPSLPDRTSVDLVAAYCVSFCVRFPLHDFSFDFTHSRTELRGDRSSGECLAAQSWPINDGLLMFGTEDGEALHARMPWLGIQVDHAIEYLCHGFRISIPYVAPNRTVGFHFVLAYNRVDAGSDAEWFAVDVPHARLVEFPVVRRFLG